MSVFSSFKRTNYSSACKIRLEIKSKLTKAFIFQNYAGAIGEEMKWENKTYPKARNPVRFNIHGHAHGLTFTCYRGMKLLLSNRACQIIANAINSSSLKCNFHVWAWVFMPEHVHLLVYPFDNHYSISEILRAIKQSSSRRIISEVKRRKPECLGRLETGLKKPYYRFWQDGGGYDKNFTDQNAILYQINYIHENPVRRGLVGNAIDWQWSSARYWTNEKRSPVEMNSSYLVM